MNLPEILLVEDNRDDEELTLSALSEFHVKNTIRVVRDGAEAIDYLLKKKQYAGVQTPQLVLLDLKLPKINGLEVLKRMRAEEMTRGIPVVVFTSSKEESDLIASYRLGANSYVQKPVDFDDFGRAVSHLGVYWLMVNQYPTHWIGTGKS